MRPRAGRLLGVAICAALICAARALAAVIA